MDQSKKTMRHFYCRDVLWETFEQMANDFDCSIDYLVNEAMRYYARSKNYQSPGGPPGATGQNPPSERPERADQRPAPAANGAGPSGNSYPPKPNGGPGNRAPATSPPPQPSGMGNMGGPGAGGMAAQRRAAPPTPGYARNAPNSSAMPPQASNPGIAERSERSGAMPAGGPTLFLVYNGQRYPVTKDQFIIGRGSKTSDLAIKDGNISRKHAAVIRRNGTFYIKDLGSTNGIDYKGMRIDNKRIDEGDVFHLCDYELRFTYRVDG
jgi:hypothetical protein